MEMVMESRKFQDEYKPISAAGYLGYQFLFAIPVLGLIIVIFSALGARNRNVKNFARAELLVIFIGVAVALALSYFGAGN